MRNHLAHEFGFYKLLLILTGLRHIVVAPGTARARSTSGLTLYDSVDLVAN